MYLNLCMQQFAAGMCLWLTGWRAANMATCTVIVWCSDLQLLCCCCSGFAGRLQQLACQWLCSRCREAAAAGLAEVAAAAGRVAGASVGVGAQMQQPQTMRATMHSATRARSEWLSCTCRAFPCSN
jgi:hypothetical protein